ncbi:hypothetical protein VST7929_02583 [Vibrio stylophorae]|uniref:Uncharacterized protein n=1 Tax=Vibrio stylophorae TaxID=659351 RepID=A0ABN8DWF0_9VIBR|nr:hypothetical protein [Vibrio stylophorae]CAH0534633.1 hypothetical protein VST7929_02583 [Vibrio stylophorae]
MRKIIGFITIILSLITLLIVISSFLNTSSNIYGVSYKDYIKYIYRIFVGSMATISSLAIFITLTLLAKPQASHSVISSTSNQPEKESPQPNNPDKNTADDFELSFNEGINKEISKQQLKRDEG